MNIYCNISPKMHKYSNALSKKCKYDKPQKIICAELTNINIQKKETVCRKGHRHCGCWIHSHFPYTNLQTPVQSHTYTCKHTHTHTTLQ